MRRKAIHHRFCVNPEENIGQRRREPETLLRIKVAPSSRDEPERKMRAFPAADIKQRLFSYMRIKTSVQKQKHSWGRENGENSQRAALASHVSNI